MTISEMCESFGVTARTLRYYEARDLLAPVRQKQKRLYTSRDRGRLKLIQRGKRFGFSLEEIRHLLDLYDIGDQMQTQIQQVYDRGLLRLAEMEKQRVELDDTIVELKALLDSGAARLSEYNDAQTRKSIKPKDQ
ncbi:MAG: MerR family transcriptional regulator [Paracoccaceae bacterium]